jgi:GNAT superfamily N-acetyltransferase
MAEVDVVRTYLEMSEPAQLRAVPLDRRVRLDRSFPCTIPFFRFLYREVGQQYNWHDRFVWTDEQCRARLDSPNVEIWVLYAEGSPAGYFELERHTDASVEIVYFGLMPDFLGRGLGKQMLTAAVKRCWEMGAKRVWLHTCTQDNPAALPNYVKRGFTPYKTENVRITLAAAPVRAAPPPA